ncbi:NTP transferase domain-containing protein [Sulfoacidibacillus ferrooxidans]|uniref:Bifunctional protein GlmU n=1 Tax=Sulfoacidibacillus ferrooxidans TaxID=2005001 RepID=A0A9X1V7N2_9BACL|nr:phosphocholine cytidylyltransferase family protein [Sulfoacidibacillus ferrooxidans]MCI0182702.1 Bifunctional protein GlmU [Sulfoacidibacillus ferrooxidans]
MTTHATAIILAAGLSSRLRPLTDETPKCLLPMGDRTILDWQLYALTSIGIEDIVIVVGYKQELVRAQLQEKWPQLRVTYVVNEDYATTNTLFSLAMAFAQVPERDFYYLNADVVFHKEIVTRLDPYENGAFLAIDCKQCREEEVKVRVSQNSIIEIGKEMDPNICLGEFIGVAKFSGSFVHSFRETVARLAIPGNERKFFEYALDELTRTDTLTPVDITGIPCVEVDFKEDYDYAVSYVIKHFGE